MIGAIKRRWKSKKAKVLHKGSELSTSSDSCPASRGFVDGCEDFDKMIKPPSPRQIHPVLEKGDVKYSPNLPPLPHQVHSCNSNNKKSSTLPHNSEEGCPFIRVNSGRIELVSSREPVGGGKCSSTHRHHHRLSPPSPQTMNENEILSEKLRRLGGRLRNDARHSWCGSAFRDGQTSRTKCSMSGLVLSEDQQHPPSANKEENGNLPTPAEDAYSTTAEEQEILRLKTSLLQDRLDVIESITRNCQSWQSEEKSEYERCMSDLASQVSKAVSLQQLMKAEVEKLQQRVLELETNNRTMATMVIPTLMKLQETVGKEEAVEEKDGESLARIPKKSDMANENNNQQQQPKQKKPDCRIPTRMTARLNRASNPLSKPTQSKELLSSSSPEPTKPNANSNGVSKVSASSSPSHRRLSPFPTSKSESSSPNGGSCGSPHKSSTYSGIPRMASPRPRLAPTEIPKKPTSSSLPLASGGARSRNGSKLPELHSRLPVLRKSIQNPKHLTPGPLISPLLVGVLPKATKGKDEGYSTMSSEALAEQENAELSVSRTVEKVIEKFNSLSTSGTKGLHKSNTFSTFRESPGLPSNCGSPQKQLIRTGEKFTSLPKSSNRTYVTANNVRIIRGVPGSYEIELDGSAYEEPSTSTVLWEDSDDSDILFLPLEMSSGASSPSTLVPDSLRSSAQSTTTETLTSVSEGRAPVALRRSRGEELVALLAQVPDNDELEERALIEKWMRLEDVRNQVQVDDEWAWDWDGVERTHKFSRRQQEEESDLWEANEATPEPISTSSQIDSSTWTKSKGSKRVATPQTFDKEKELELEKLSLETAEQKPLISLETRILIAEQSGGPETDSHPDPCPSPPPVIEFTPEFYQLVKYGSSGSVNDNELQGRSQASRRCKIVIPKMRMASQSSSSSSEDFSGRMDDKISQTDFGSSLENLSISSELFTECRNCLELVKRLVGGIDEACNGGSSGLGMSTSADCHSTNTLDRVREQEKEELGADHGSSTTWVSVPKGLPTTEVDRIFEILSSSESEDVLSPGK